MAKARSRRDDPPPGADPAGPTPKPESDALLFRAAVRDVKPLPEGARAVHPPRRPRRRHLPPASPDTSEFALLPESPAGEDAPTGAEVLSFRRPGVRTQTLKHLRRGLYPIDDELDLHGLSQAAARDSLADFLAYNRNAGHRCVRIVHGKGYRSGARGPVLKIAVNTWLRRHGDVMAFTSARAIDGGTGAVYVLLRA